MIASGVVKPRTLHLQVMAVLLYFNGLSGPPCIKHRLAWCRCRPAVFCFRE